MIAPIRVPDSDWTCPKYYKRLSTESHSPRTGEHEMKIKGELNKYCPRCHKHTVHTVSTYKAGKRRSQAEGERRMRRKTKGYGSFPKNIQKRFAKTTKKTVLKLKCKECEHIIQSKSMRLKKVEVQRV